MLGIYCVIFVFLLLNALKPKMHVAEEKYNVSKLFSILQNFFYYIIVAIFL